MNKMHLISTPGFNFQSFKNTLFLFLPHLIQNKVSRKRCFIAVLLILMDVLATALVPYFSKCIVDELSVNLSASFGFSLLMLGLFWILEKTLHHVQDIVFFPVINISIRDITRDVVEHIHRLPLSVYQTLSMPEVLNSIKRISYSARQFFNIFFLTIFPTMIKLVIAVIVAAKLGLHGIALLPVFLLCFFTLYKGTQHYVKSREQSWQFSDGVIMRINDSILNTKITRQFQDFEMSALKSILNQEAELWYNTNTRLHIIYIFIGILLGLSITAILYNALLNIQHHSLTIGDFVLLKGQLIAALLPLQKLCTEFRQLAESTIDIGKIRRILELPLEKNSKSEEKTESSECIESNKSRESQKFRESTIKKTPAPIFRGIEVNELCFSYGSQSPIFDDLKLNLNAGEKIVITGENGSGKSTLASLLSGILKPLQGSILINDLNIELYSREALSALVHSIPQDVRLFNLSLRENLSYGLGDITNEKLIHTLEEVGLSPLLQSLNGDINLPLGEMGIRLSGGEKQRVAIARALLIRPSVLILDETLHSLPPESEAYILKKIFESIDTVLLISHRQDAFCYMDRVLNISNKRIETIVDNTRHPKLGKVEASATFERVDYSLETP